MQIRDYRKCYVVVGQEQTIVDDNGREWRLSQDNSRLPFIVFLKTTNECGCMFTQSFDPQGTLRSAKVRSFTDLCKMHLKDGDRSFWRLITDLPIPENVALIAESWCSPPPSSGFGKY